MCRRLLVLNVLATREFATRDCGASSVLVRSFQKRWIGRPCSRHILSLMFRPIIACAY